MTKTWSGKGKTYKGTNGNDQLTVKGSENTVNALGGKKDTIIIAKGHNHKINGGNGVDVITVKTGNYHKINGDNGNDNITLKNKGWDGSGWGGYWSSKDETYGGAGNDTIKVYKGRHRISGGIGNDTITLYGNTEDRNEIYGDAGNDKITVKGGNYHQIWAGSSTKKKKDVISIEKGNEITVWGQEGIDEIKVTGGNKHTLYGDEGNDIFSIKKASEVKMYGGIGKDKFTIYGGSNHTIETGDGKDTVTISGGSAHTIKNTGNGGNDVITINKKAGDNIKVTGHDSANETVNVYVGKGHEISLGNGENTVLIAGGINHNVYTGSNNDKITVTGSKTHVNNIGTGAGNDTVTVKNGAFVNNNNNDHYWSRVSITTGDGDDKVYIESNAGDYSFIDTKADDDMIYIRGGKSHTVYTGTGNDVIEVTGGSEHNIILEQGENQVTLNAKALTVHTNNDAADNITINWGSNKGISTIYAGGNNSVAVKDYLTIKNAKASDFDFTYQSSGWYSDLVMSNANGSIVIDNWAYTYSMSDIKQNGFDGIYFGTTKLSFDAINNLAGFPKS